MILKGGEIIERMMYILCWGLAAATLDVYFNVVNGDGNHIEGSQQSQQWGSVKTPHLPWGLLCYTLSFL